MEQLQEFALQGEEDVEGGVGEAVAAGKGEQL
jgi:hypothetical protein